MKEGTPRNDDTRWEVAPRSMWMAEHPVELDGRVFIPGRSGAFMVNDEGVANAIKQKYGEDNIMTFETKGTWHPSDKGHTYRFRGVALPWHKYDEAGRKISQPETDIRHFDIIDTVSKKTNGGTQWQEADKPP
jgi:hypothetical protein